MKIKRGKIILGALILFFLILYGGKAVFAMSGRAVFKSKGCINCHTINGNGGKAGPNLGNIGAKKSFRWLKDFIKNPDKYFNPGSSAVINGKSYIIMMPAFKNMLVRSELNSVTNYLSSLK